MTPEFLGYQVPRMKEGIVSVELSSGQTLHFGPLTCWDTVNVERELGDGMHSSQLMSLAYSWRSCLSGGGEEANGLSFQKFCELLPRQDQDAVFIAVRPFVSPGSSSPPSGASSTSDGDHPT